MCPKCGASDTELPTPKDTKHPIDGQRETKSYGKKKPRKVKRLV